MINNKLKRILSAFLAFAVVLSVYGVRLKSFAEKNETKTEAEATALSEEWTLMAEDSKLRLFLNSETTNFFVEDAATGRRVYAFPENTETDTVASPVHQIEMQSALVFTLWDPVKKMENRKNSKAGSVNSGNFIINNKENGFSIDYNLKSSGVKATLSVTLNDGKIECSVPANSVVEENPEKCMVLRIAILPYMLRGLSDTEGSLVLPDGCGEILDFSPLRASAAAYEKPIYGRNLSMNLSLEEKTGYDITYPYLGLSSPEVGVLAIPTAGASVGYVNAYPAMNQSNYANAYFSFQYRATDVAIIGDRSGKTAQTTVVIDKNTYDKDIAVRYQFNFEETGINSLARLYGEYLAPASKAADKESVTAVFDVYGFVNEKKNLFGFPYTTASVLSEAEDIIALSEDESFENIAINLKSITKADQDNKAATSLKPVSKAMSDSELERLTSGDARIYINTNPLSFKKNSFSANRFFTSSKTLYGAPVNVYEFKESTHHIDKATSKTYLLKYNKIAENIEKLTASAKKLSLSGISSEELAAISYHDYSNGGTLWDTHSAQEKACAAIAENTALVLSNPADYAVKYCSMLLDVPVSSSNNDLCAGSYPFIQIALGDSIPYTAQAINLHRSPKTAFLEALSTGSHLHYSFVLTDSEPIINSKLNYLYSADYSAFEETVKEQYNSWNEVWKATQGSGLKEYARTENRIVSVFENGAVLTVDLTDQTYSIA